MTGKILYTRDNDTTFAEFLQARCFSKDAPLAQVQVIFFFRFVHVIYISLIIFAFIVF
jgi:hypothetical protein